MNLRKVLFVSALAAAVAISPLPVSAEHGRPDQGDRHRDRDDRDHDRDHHDRGRHDDHDRDDRDRDGREHHDNGLHKGWYKHGDHDRDDDRRADRDHQHDWDHDRDRDGARAQDRPVYRDPARAPIAPRQTPRYTPTDYRRGAHAGAYQDGFNQGQLDRMGGGSRPYNRHYADPADVQAYQAGYSNGYGSRGAAVASNQFTGAANIGFQDGINDGQKDRMTGHSYRPSEGDNYKDADRGFTTGSRLEYKREYRTGYTSGYERGYNGGNGGRY